MCSLPLYLVRQIVVEKRIADRHSGFLITGSQSRVGAGTGVAGVATGTYTGFLEDGESEGEGALNWSLPWLLDV